MTKKDINDFKENEIILDSLKKEYEQKSKQYQNKHYEFFDKISNWFDNFCETVEKIKELSGTEIVLGLPVNMDGSLSFRADKSKAFAEMLSKETGLNVIFVDERLSTVEAYTYLNITDYNGKKRRSVIDALSAQIILQSHLDSRKNKG